MNIGAQVLAVLQNSRMGSAQSPLSANSCQGNGSNDGKSFAEFLNSSALTLGVGSSSVNSDQDASSLSNPASLGLSLQDIVKIVQRIAGKSSSVSQTTPDFSQDKSTLPSNEVEDYSSLLQMILGSLRGAASTGQTEAADSTSFTGDRLASSDILSAGDEISLLLKNFTSLNPSSTSGETTNGTTSININAASSEPTVSSIPVQEIIRILLSMRGKQLSQTSPQNSTSGLDETQSSSDANVSSLTGTPLTAMLDQLNFVPPSLASVQNSIPNDAKDATSRSNISAANPTSGIFSDRVDLSLYSKVEQGLALLLRDNAAPKLPDSTDGTQKIQNLTTLAKQASNDPTLKADLLRLLSNSPNSSQNLSFRDEVEKLLSEIPDAGSGSGPSGSQTNISSRPFMIQHDGTSQIQSGAPSVVKGMNSVVLQSLQTARVVNANPGVSPGKVFPTTIGTIIKSPNVVTSQSTASSVVQSRGTSVNLDPQSGDKSDSSADAPKTSVINAPSTADKQDASAKNTSGKPDSGTTLLGRTSRSISELYASTATDGISSKVESFKQTLSGLTHPESVPDEMTTKPDALQVAQTVIREARIMTQENKTVMNVKLEPESLGSVVLKVASEDGKISAEFNVRTPDAKVYMEASIPQMKQMLQSNGVSLSHLTVQLSSGESPASEGKQQQYRSKKNRTVQSNASTFSMDALSGSVEAARNFGYNTMEVKV